MSVDAFFDPARISDVARELFLHPYGQRFILHPEQLNGFDMLPDLTWLCVRFSPDNADSVSDTRGAYAFVIKSAHPALPPHGYVTYIEITGSEAEQRTLQIRYREYLRHQRLTRVKRRVGVNNMLRLWQDCLYFYYATISRPTDLRDLELALNDCLIPPFVTDDFSPTIRAAKAAFELR